MYLRGAHVALIGYDISNLPSFERAKLWIPDARRHGLKDIVVVLIACKSDLQDRRKVDNDEVEAFAKEHGCLHVQTSAKNELNVDKPFIDGAMRWLDQHNSST